MGFPIIYRAGRDNRPPGKAAPPTSPASGGHLPSFPPCFPRKRAGNRGLRHNLYMQAAGATRKTLRVRSEPPLPFRFVRTVIACRRRLPAGAAAAAPVARRNRLRIAELEVSEGTGRKCRLVRTTAVLSTVLSTYNFVNKRHHLSSHLAVSARQFILSQTCGRLEVSEKPGASNSGTHQAAPRTAARR